MTSNIKCCLIAVFKYYIYIQDFDIRERHSMYEQVFGLTFCALLLPVAFPQQNTIIFYILFDFISQTSDEAYDSLVLNLLIPTNQGIGKKRKNTKKQLMIWETIRQFI